VHSAVTVVAALNGSVRLSQNEMLSLNGY